jgi:hypothetical protein
VGYRDRGTRSSLPFRLEEPTAESIAALDLEIYVAALDHQSSIVTSLDDKGSRPALAIEPLPDIVDRIQVEARVEIVRDVADMRCRQEVRQTTIRMIRRQRLLIEDVKRGAGDLAIAKHCDQVGGALASIAATT